MPPNAVSRAKVREMYTAMGSWKNVGKALGVNPGVAHLYAFTDYTPKRQDLREAFGLEIAPKATYIRQVRNSEGRFV